MGTEIIEMGKISSRGQIAIPSGIRQELDLNEGNKVLFVLEDDTLIMKKVTSKSFREITRPLKEAAKKAGFKESDVGGIVHRARKE
jgi:AbrB family looped-hinge helix DNA binding protein